MHKVDPDDLRYRESKTLAKSSISRLLAVWMCAATLVAGSGCMSMQTVGAPTAPESWADVHAGEAVDLTLHDGRQIELAFVEWTGQALVGRDASGGRLNVEAVDIQSASVKRFSAGRSVLLAVAVVGVAAAADVGKSVSDSLTR